MSHSGVCRWVNEADFDLVWPLEQQGHLFPWSENTLRQSLSTKRCLGLFEQERLIAFAVVSLVVGEAELLNVVTDKTFRGRGVAYRLLSECIHLLGADAERMYLEVRVSNTPAIALYDKLGFVEVGVRENYYPAKQGREDALLMALELSITE